MGPSVSCEAVWQLHFRLESKINPHGSVLPPTQKTEFHSEGLRERLPAKAEDTMQRSSTIDRRSGEDRRKVHDLDYSARGGAERRSSSERRSQRSERRSDWVMIDRWYSIALGPIASSPHLELDEIPGEPGPRTGQNSRKTTGKILPFKRSFPVP